MNCLKISFTARGREAAKKVIFFSGPTTKASMLNDSKPKC